MAAQTDYDAPRRNAADDAQDDLTPTLKARRDYAQSGQLDVDVEIDYEPGVLDHHVFDLSIDDLSVPVVPRQRDEFLCSRCFLVHPNSRAAHRTGPKLCRDCA